MIPRLTIFFFNDTATTEIYTLSLHDALPISSSGSTGGSKISIASLAKDLRSSRATTRRTSIRDRKSTRLNSSHANNSYAVFCLKKKKLRGPHMNKSMPFEQYGLTHTTLVNLR